jgi:hypothetical protein
MLGVYLGDTSLLRPKVGLYADLVADCPKVVKERGPNPPVESIEGLDHAMSQEATESGNT